MPPPCHNLLLFFCLALSSGATSAPPAGAAGDYPKAQLAIKTAPVGNGFETMTTLNIEGTTAASATREYLVNIGLVSNTGSSAATTPYRDKVALYTATEAHNGTGDVWAINPLVTQMPGSGNYAAQGIELDFNNNNEHRGDADAGAGLAQPVSYGLSVTGAGSKRSTSAILVCGEKDMWNRGIVFANGAIAQSTFQDLTSPLKSIDIRGNPGFGVYQSSAKSQNWFNGDTGIGVMNTSGYKLSVNGRAISTGGWVKADGRSITNISSADATGWLQNFTRLHTRAYHYEAAVGDGENQQDEEQPQLGLVAQEVEEVLPELVRTDRAGQKAVSYERLSLVLLEAVKSQQQQMESMERERLGLVEKHAALEARLEALEQGVLVRAAD